MAKSLRLRKTATRKRSVLRLCALRLTLAALLGWSPAAALSAEDDGGGPAAAVDDAVIRLAAGSIGDVLNSVADSTRALGEAYARLAAQGVSPTSSPADEERWNALRYSVGRTTGLRTWSGDGTDEPDYQAPYPSFYTYDGAELDDRVLRELGLFKEFAPIVRTAYESFPFSWVYLTTPDQSMIIYPYLPIEKAVHNAMPTETPFYRAANFAERTVGWSSPYLDLVGAGMMVTASYPVYDGSDLLGVMSRDITLQELTKQVLSNLTADTDGTALIVDDRGLAIAASDPQLAAEIDRVNTAAGTAALYYRNVDDMAAVADKDAVASSSPFINALVEQVLDKAGDSNESVRLVRKDGRVLAQRIEGTGWLAVLFMASPIPETSEAKAE